MPPFDQTNILVRPHKDRSLIMIAFGVFFGHVLLLLWSILVHQEIKTISPPVQRRLLVQTVALNPERSPVITTIALQEPRPRIKTEVEPKVATEEIKTIEPEPVVETKIVPENKEKDIATPPPEEPVVPVLPTTPPIPEIKEEIVNPSKEIAPKTPPVKPSEPPTLVAKALTPKKPEIKKKVEEKPIIKKVVSKPPPTKTETPKKTAIKPAEKKVTPSSSPAPALTPAPAQPKKTEVDKVALEHQKRIETEQQAAKAKQQKLLSQAQEMIAKIDKSRDKVSRTDFPNSQYVSPGAITSLQSDSIPDYNKQQWSPKEASYRDELASRLKLLLKLPEYGEVKIKLILERSGKVASVIVISSASIANRKYIEKMLPTLKFPAFGANFNQSPQFTFSITLCNDL